MRKAAQHKGMPGHRAKWGNRAFNCEGIKDLWLDPRKKKTRAQLTGPSKPNPGTSRVSMEGGANGEGGGCPQGQGGESGMGVEADSYLDQVRAMSDPNQD